MESPIKREFILEGLGCANCAAKIEQKINELDEVSMATVSFVSKALKIEFNNENEESGILEAVKKIVSRIEPDVKVIAVNKHKFNKVHGSIKVAVNHNNEHGHEHDYKNEDKHQREDDHECEDEHEHEDDHEHDHGDEHEGHHHGEKSKSEFIKLGVGVAFYAAALVLKLDFYPGLILFLVSYVLIGGDVLLNSIKNIGRGQVFDENFLMSIATIGAFAIGQFPEGVAVMLFYQVGELFQDMAVERSRKSISSLMDIRPDYANLLIRGELKKVSPEEVSTGSLIVVKPGERVPLDGKVVEGRSMLDTSALTGESVPREASIGDSVLGGFINKNGVLTIEVAKEYGESTVAKILDLVENASTKKAPTENFISKFAKYYTPVVVFSAAALAVLPPIFIKGAVFSDWLYRALVFLVVSCPCALVISIPLGFFGGIGGASKRGILIKGGNYLEALNSVEIVVFDKTGTLTKGVFKVTKVWTEEGIKEEELLEFAAYAESFSNHPIAVSILNAYGDSIDRDKISDYSELSGHGIKVKVKGRDVLIGNAKLMKEENIEYKSVDTMGTMVHLALDKGYAGYIVISDEIKEDSVEAIKALKAIGIKKTVMLTGDNKTVAEKVGSTVGIDEVYSELLPDGKVNAVEKLQKSKSPKGKLVFVGDGINDAPVLARADIGIAMGGIGSDAAIEAADVVIMTDEPSKIAEAISIAKKTRSIVMQNIIFALGVKIIILVLGAFGIATMWEAVFGDVGVALIAVLNSMRALKTK